MVNQLILTDDEGLRSSPGQNCFGKEKINGLDSFSMQGKHNMFYTDGMYRATHNWAHEFWKGTTDIFSAEHFFFFFFLCPHELLIK